MKTILKNGDLKELVIVKEYPEGFSVSDGLIEREVQREFHSWEITTREILMDGLLIQQRNFQNPRELEFEVEHDFPFLKMHFELKGYSLYTNSVKGSLDVEIPSGSHMLIFLPEVKGKLSYPKSRDTLEIILSVDYLNRIFLQDLTPLKEFGIGVQNEVPVLGGPKSLPITPAMKEVIFSIVHCAHEGAFRRIFLEAKIQELLILQVEQFYNYNHEEQKVKLNQLDLDKLYFVRELVERNLQKPYSLDQLSSLSGLNSFKLKKGFKEMFGTSVFSYLTDVRMEQAKSLIVKEEKSIADAAFLVGYKNPQHFTVAFKRKFGYLPSTLKS